MTGVCQYCKQDCYWSHSRGSYVCVNCTPDLCDRCGTPLDAFSQPCRDTCSACLSFYLDSNEEQKMSDRYEWTDTPTPGLWIRRLPPSERLKLCRVVVGGKDAQYKLRPEAYTCLRAKKHCALFRQPKPEEVTQEWKDDQHRKNEWLDSPTHRGLWMRRFPHEQHNVLPDSVLSKDLLCKATPTSESSWGWEYFVYQKDGKFGGRDTSSGIKFRLPHPWEVPDELWEDYQEQIKMIQEEWLEKGTDEPADGGFVHSPDWTGPAIAKNFYSGVEWASSIRSVPGSTHNADRVIQYQNRSGCWSVLHLSSKHLKFKRRTPDTEYKTSESEMPDIGDTEVPTCQDVRYDVKGMIEGLSDKLNRLTNRVEGSRQSIGALKDKMAQFANDIAKASEMIPEMRVVYNKRTDKLAQLAVKVDEMRKDLIMQRDAIRSLQESAYPKVEVPLRCSVCSKFNKKPKKEKGGKMLAKTMLKCVAVGLLALVFCATPIVGQWFYNTGPEWIRLPSEVKGQPTVFTCICIMFLVMISGGALCISISKDSDEARKKAKQNEN